MTTFMLIKRFVCDTAQPSELEALRNAAWAEAH